MVSAARALRDRLLGLMGAGGLATVLALLDQGLVSGFGFLSGVTAARLVDIESFGRFALVTIVIMLAQAVHNALITAPMMTLAGARSRPSRAYLASVIGAAGLLSGIVGTVVAGLLAAYLALRHEPFSILFITAVLALGAAQTLQYTLRRLMFASGHGGQAAAMDALRALAFPLGLAGAWAAGVHFTVTVLLALLAATAALSSLPFLRPYLSARRRAFRFRAVARRHTPIARWLLPVVVLTFLQEQLVWIVAGLMLGEGALGGLRASQYIIGLVLLLLAATENVVPVGASRALATGGRAGLDRFLVSTGLKLGLLLAVPLLVIVAGAPVWLTLLFGPAYAPFADCLRLLALGVLLIHVRDMASQLFRATQRTGVIFQAFAVSLAVSGACLYPLLVHAGLRGAALVVVIGHLTSMAYMLLSVRLEGRVLCRLRSALGLGLMRPASTRG